MARLFISISNPKSQDTKDKISSELKRLSGKEGFKTDSLESQDKRVFITYCEKTRHSFKYEYFEKENTHIVLGGGGKFGSTAIKFADILSAYHGNKLNDYVKNCKGSFYICIIDEKRKQTTLIKDIFGATPIFYHQSEEGLLISNFSSLLSYAVNNGKRKEDKAFVARFSVNHYAETYGEGFTFYENVTEIKPATTIVFQNGKKEEENYWDKDLEMDFFTEDEKSMTAKYKELLFDVVKNDFEDLGKFAFTLSGGMDSGTLISLYHHFFNERPPAISVTYHENVRANELELIEPVAKQLAGSWFNIQPTKHEFFEEMDNIYQQYDHPWVTATVYAQDRLFRGFKENGFEQLISGSGGDHHMAGSYPNFLYYFAYLKHNQLNDLFDKEVEKWIEYHSEAPWFKTRDTVEEFLNRCIDFSSEGALKINREFLAPEMDLLTKDYMANHKFLEPFPSYGDYFRSYTMKEIRRSAFPPALWAESIMAWRNDIEEVSPFWDKELFEFCWNIPHKYKIKDGMNKIMVRNVTENIVPDHIRLRIAKTGFNMPFDVWVYDETVRVKMMDIFNSQKFRERGVFNPACVDQMLAAHFAKEKNYGMQLWQILNLELWFRDWIDS